MIALMCGRVFGFSSGFAAQNDPVVPPAVAASVLADNMAFLRHMNMFDPNFGLFANELCASVASTMSADAAPTTGMFVGICCGDVIAT